MRGFQTIASLTGVITCMPMMLIAACALPETSTVDTCPWQTDSNTTDRNDTVLTQIRTRHYTGTETFCGGHAPRRMQDFDTFHQYMMYHTRLATIRRQTRDPQHISKR